MRFEERHDAWVGYRIPVPHGDAHAAWDSVRDTVSDRIPCHTAPSRDPTGPRGIRWTVQEEADGLTVPTKRAVADRSTIDLIESSAYLPWVPSPSV